jgi:hypothetical protein
VQVADPLTEAAVLSATARVPSHVVFRAFPRETVMLNLDTGKYHGVNPTAGRMLELLEKSETVDEVAARMADEYGRDVDEIRRDLYGLCLELRERGLLEIVSDDGNAV